MARRPGPAQRRPQGTASAPPARRRRPAAAPPRAPNAASGERRNAVSSRTARLGKIAATAPSGSAPCAMKKLRSPNPRHSTRAPGNRVAAAASAPEASADGAQRSVCQPRSAIATHETGCTGAGPGCGAAAQAASAVSAGKAIAARNRRIIARTPLRPRACAPLPHPARLPVPQPGPDPLHRLLQRLQAGGVGEPHMPVPQRPEAGARHRRHPRLVQQPGLETP